MQNIKSFNQFKTQRNLLSLENVDLSNDLFSQVFENLLSSKMVDNNIREEIRNYISNQDIMINESFFDKLKDRFPKASEVSNLLSDKGEKILNKILNGTKDAVNFVKKLKDGFKDLFKKYLDNFKNLISKQLKSGKISDKIKELNDNQKEGLKTDIKTGKDITQWYSKNFLSSIMKSLDKDMVNFLKSEQEPVVESILLEKGNVIATLTHGIEKIPPFSWLAKVAEIGEAGANKMIKVLSKVTNKLGGPSFELPVIALLLGVLFEQMVKNNVGHWLIDIVGSATPMGMAIKGIKMIALVIAFIVSIDAIFGNKILGSDHH